MRKYLIIKMSSIGDIIQALPAASYLKQIDPDAKIYWAVETRFASLVKSCPDIDEVISIDFKRWKKRAWQGIQEGIKTKKTWKTVQFDEIFDLQGNLKSLIILQLFSAKIKTGFSRSCVPEAINCLVTNKKIELSFKGYLPHHYVEFVQKALNQVQTRSLPEVKLTVDEKEKTKIDQRIFSEVPKNLIMICPHSNWENKKLLSSFWKSFLKQIEKKQDLQFVFIHGNENELEENLITFQPTFEKAFFIGALPFSTWQYLMRKCQMVIAVDSSALHLAALANVPTLSIFGPSSSNIYAPKGSLHKSLQGSCPYGETFTKRCRYLRTCQKAPCTKELDPIEASQLFAKHYQKLFINCKV